MNIAITPRDLAYDPVEGPRRWKAAHDRVCMPAPAPIVPRARIDRDVLDVATVPPDEPPLQPVPMDGLRDWMPVNAIETRQRRLTMGLIVRVTAETYDVALKDLLSPRRTHKFIEPREVAMYLCRVLTDYSFPQIGRTLHRDHTSVLAGFRRVGRRILDNPDFAVRVEQIASAIAALVRESEAAS